MRRLSLVLAALTLGAAVARDADAQARTRRSPRAFFTISDGLGVGTGGALNGGVGLSQMMRVGGAVRVRGGSGLDISAVRVQMVLPTDGRFSDPEIRSPAGDGLFLSYGSFKPRRGGGFPSVFTLGPGVMSRKRGDGSKLETGAIRIGFDGETMNRLTEWMDFNVSAHLIVMPARDRRQMYTAALSLGFRIG
jgi:hypothetical protein